MIQMLLLFTSCLPCHLPIEPETPSYLIPVSNTASSIGVTWLAPVGDVDVYQVTYSPADGTTLPSVIIEATSPLELRIDNLLPSTDYTFSVKAVSGRDASFRESEPVQAVFRTGTGLTNDHVIMQLPSL